MESSSLASRLVSALTNAIKPAFTTLRFLVLVMLPVSLVVMLLDASGVLAIISHWLDPVMHFLGLPGQASLVFISSISLNLYSAIAVIGRLDLSPREVAILASMCLLAHSLIIECAIMKRTGTSFAKTVFMRIFAALASAWILNKILPPSFGPRFGTHASELVPALNLSLSNLPNLFFTWFKDSGILVIKLTVIIYALMIVQKFLEEFKLLDLLAKVLYPIVAFFGLPRSTSFLWIVANVIGLAYGSAVLIEQTDSEKIPIQDANLLNHHLALSHSLLEDSILFVLMGVPIVLIILPRLAFAFAAAWLERLRRWWLLKTFKVGIL